MCHLRGCVGEQHEVVQAILVQATLVQATLVQATLVQATLVATQGSQNTVSISKLQSSLYNSTDVSEATKSSKASIDVYR